MEQEVFPQQFNQGFLQVSPKHKIWYTECGNPEGVPVLVFHGGPGSRSKPKHLNFFNLESMCVILFDQRGCGKSLPSGELADNTTQNLIEDAEQLRIHLKIPRLILAGGSWGSTLALLYAEKYPEVVASIYLRGVFLGRKTDTDWLLGDNGAARLFPDLREKRNELFRQVGLDPHASTAQLLKTIEKASSRQRKKLVATISSWEDNLLMLETAFNFTDPEDITEEDIHSCRVFLHYDSNNYFLKSNQILKQASILIEIPVVIVHGRYDVICPLAQAYELHKALPGSELEITNYDGHKLGHESERLSYRIMENLGNQF